VAGDGVSDDDIAEVTKTIEDDLPGLRVEALHGGQTTPTFAIGVE
jgi:hypothetical protein